MDNYESLLHQTIISNVEVVRGKTTILQDVNLTIEQGDLLAIIGLNGAGKSTLLKTIIGEIRYKGNIAFVDKNGIKVNKPNIGYVPQQLLFDRSSPVSVLDLFSSIKTTFPVWINTSHKIRDYIYNLLKKVNAEHLIDKRIGDLSGGELQRVMLAFAIDPIPDLLILDEPSSALDKNGSNIFYNLVFDLQKKYNISILLVSHDIKIVKKYASKTVFLNRSIECYGNTKEVLESERVRDAFNIYSSLEN